MKLPEYMLEMLRGRFCDDDDDRSKDAEFERMEPSKIVRECVGWELGDPRWANRIAGFMKATGAKPEDF